MMKFDNKISGLKGSAYEFNAMSYKSDIIHPILIQLIGSTYSIASFSKSFQIRKVLYTMFSYNTGNDFCFMTGRVQVASHIKIQSSEMHRRLMVLSWAWMDGASTAIIVDEIKFKTRMLKECQLANT